MESVFSYYSIKTIRAEFSLKELHHSKEMYNLHHILKLLLSLWNILILMTELHKQNVITKIFAWS